MIDYAVVDLETSTKNRGEDAIGKFSASPHHPENQIVSAGLTPLNGKYCGWYYTDAEWQYTFESALRSFDLWVGQHFKFDLLYMMRCVPNIAEVLPHKKIWDTQLAEYLLTGQESTYAHLNDLSAKYGGTQKVDKMKGYFEGGIETEDIPKDELMEYMQYDVENTEVVFLAQYKQAEERGLLPFFESQMEALLATTEMEFNGMCFDRDLALKHAEVIEARLKEPLARVNDLLINTLTDFPKEISASSVDQLSLVIFGGEYEKKVKVPWLDADGNEQFIKSGVNKGKLKERNGTETVHVPSWFVPDPKWAVKKAGMYAVDDATLSKVKSRTSDTALPAFIEALLEVRNYQKELSTYLYGFSDLAWPSGQQRFIHGSIGHVGTATGRTNSSSPNMQNLSGREDD